MSTSEGSAQVYVNGQFRGSTPITLQLNARQYYIVEFRKPGYMTRRVHVGSHVNPTYLILDVIFGLWPAVIDLATGAWNSLNFHVVNATMTPVTAVYSAPQPAVEGCDEAPCQ